MSVGFIGTSEYVIPVIEKLNNNFDLKIVITAPDKKQGRHNKLTASPVKNYTKDNLNTELLTSDNLLADIEIIKKNLPDIFVLAAYGYIIPDEILSLSKYGIINIHPSLLPKYRGPSPIQTSLLNNDKVTGVTIIKLDSDLDHGPVLEQKLVKINKNDNNLTLHKKLFEIGSDMLPELIKKISQGKSNQIEQNHKEATFTQKIAKSDGYFDLNENTKYEDIINKINAYYPWPSAWTKLKINENEKILKFFPDKKIQLEGKTVVSFEDFLNGHSQFREYKIFS